MRYRYRGQVLEAVDYEHYHRNLDGHRLRDPARSYNFGLDLGTRGLSEPSGRERGDTLYLPPARADAGEVRRLADCIAGNATLLRTRLQDTVIVSHSLLGLMRHTARPQRDGIARLIHAESPFLGIYQHTHLLRILRDGRVMAQTDNTADNPAGAVQIGRIERVGKGKPALYIRAHHHLGGSPHEVRYLRLWPPTGMAAPCRTTTASHWKRRHEHRRRRSDRTPSVDRCTALSGAGCADVVAYLCCALQLRRQPLRAGMADRRSAATHRVIKHGLCGASASAASDMPGSSGEKPP